MRKEASHQKGAAINLLLIDRGFILQRKAHGREGAVRGYH